MVKGSLKSTIYSESVKMNHGERPFMLHPRDADDLNPCGRDFHSDFDDDVPELVEYVLDEPETCGTYVMNDFDVDVPELVEYVLDEPETCGTYVMNEDHHFRPIARPDQQISELQQDQIIASPLAMLQDVVESYTLHLQRNPWETPNYGQLFGPSIWSNAVNKDSDSWSMDLNIDPKGKQKEFWSCMLLYPRNEVLYDFNEMKKSLDNDVLEAYSSQHEASDSTERAHEWPVHEPWTDAVPVEASGVLGAEPDVPVKPWTPWNGPDLDNTWRMMIPAAWGIPDPEPDFSRETCPVLAQFILNGTMYGDLNQLNGDLPELPSPADPNVKYCEDLEQSGPADHETENIVSWLVSSQDASSKCPQCGQLTAGDWSRFSCCDLAGALSAAVDQMENEGDSASKLLKSCTFEAGSHNGD